MEHTDPGSANEEDLDEQDEPPLNGTLVEAPDDEDDPDPDEDRTLGMSEFTEICRRRMVHFV